MKVSKDRIKSPAIFPDLGNKDLLERGTALHTILVSALGIWLFMRLDREGSRIAGQEISELLKIFRAEGTEI